MINNIHNSGAGPWDTSPTRAPFFCRCTSKGYCHICGWNCNLHDQNFSNIIQRREDPAFGAGARDGQGNETDLARHGPRVGNSQQKHNGLTLMKLKLPKVCTRVWSPCRNGGLQYVVQAWVPTLLTPWHTALYQHPFPPFPHFHQR